MKGDGTFDIVWGGHVEYKNRTQSKFGRACSSTWHGSTSAGVGLRYQATKAKPSLKKWGARPNAGSTFSAEDPTARLDRGSEFLDIRFVIC